MSGVTAQHARRILEANLVNLAKKAQEGRVLSAQEIALLQGMADGTDAPAVHPVWVQNQVELATILGVNRKTIQRWLKENGNPGAQSDGRYSVPAWREWARSKGSKVDGDEDLNQTQLKARQILLQNQKLEFSLGVLRKEYAPTTLLKAWGGELGANIRKVVTQIHLIAPSIVGLPVPDAEARLKELEDEILEQLHGLDEGISKWEQEPAL